VSGRTASYRNHYRNDRLLTKDFDPQVQAIQRFAMSAAMQIAPIRHRSVSSGLT